MENEKTLAEKLYDLILELDEEKKRIGGSIADWYE